MPGRASITSYAHASDAGTGCRGTSFATFGRAGFDPPAVLERLEYRAQVVALSQAADPRVSLSECLRLVEGVGPGTGVHARAYEDLLERFLRVLDQRVQREPEEWPEIDPSRALVGQLHLLEPDQVRELGRVIARQIGMP